MAGETVNTVTFSAFFSCILQTQNFPIGTIFIDDPIGHFEDINILGFADLLRSVLGFCIYQIVIPTHDEVREAKTQKSDCPKGDTDE